LLREKKEEKGETEMLMFRVEASQFLRYSLMYIFGILDFTTRCLYCKQADLSGGECSLFPSCLFYSPSPFFRTLLPRLALVIQTSRSFQIKALQVTLPPSLTRSLIILLLILRLHKPGFFQDPQTRLILRVCCCQQPVIFLVYCH
jgi:hypothetical protein